MLKKDPMLHPKYRLGEGYRALPSFYSPLADSREFPKPLVRVVPDLLTGRGRQGTLLPRSGVNAMFVDRARTALFLIANMIAPGKVWLPAYHCPAMLEPLVAAGCEVAFYPIEENLTPDFGFLDSHVRPGEAVVGVRYFGFDTGIRELAAFCESQELLLIEDMAHAAYFDQMVGNFGVTSLVKFLPVNTGGELLLPKRSGHAAQMLGLYRSLPSGSRVEMNKIVSKLAKRLRLAQEEHADYRYFRSDLIHRGLTQNDRATINKSDHQAIVERRRANYRYLAHALIDNPNGVAIFPFLPDHVVPYVLPFWLADEEGFERVRFAGIQALRWEEMVPTDCDLVGALRTRLIQLPVHQGLERHELDAIAAALVH